MKIGIVIPTRGNRELFFANWKRMFASQVINSSIKKINVCIVDFEPSDDKVDITKRYKYGYEKMNQLDVDCILFMEDDDWYSPNYIQTMVDNWVSFNKPILFGTSYTIYYHLRLHKHFTMNHTLRSSMMSTLIVPNLPINWPVDHEPFTDAHIWKQFNGVTFTPDSIICLGIKHGDGISGGRFHNDRLERYVDEHLDIKTLMDHESYEFYNNYYKDDTCEIIEITSPLGKTKVFVKK